MAISFYDKSFLDKLTHWCGNTSLHIYSPSDTKRLFEVLADESNDKPIQLPILCLTRKGGYEILNPNKRPLTYDGFTLNGEDGWVVSDLEHQIVSKNFLFIEDAYKYKNQLENPEKYRVIRMPNGRTTQLNAIPVNIEYQLDIYTRYLEEADEYMRNIIFNVINYPTLTIDIPYLEEHYTHYATIRINPSIEDNSDIPERLVKGQFSRLTATIVIDDAYIWDIRDRDNRYIDCINVVAD